MTTKGYRLKEETTWKDVDDDSTLLPQFKACCMCGEWKFMDSYFNNSNSADGKQGYCKSCQRANHRVYLETERGRDSIYRANKAQAYKKQLQNLGVDDEAIVNPLAKMNKEDRQIERRKFQRIIKSHCTGTEWKLLKNMFGINTPPMTQQEYAKMVGKSDTTVHRYRELLIKRLKNDVGLQTLVKGLLKS